MPTVQPLKMIHCTFYFPSQMDTHWLNKMKEKASYNQTHDGIYIDVKNLRVLK